MALDLKTNIRAWGKEFGFSQIGFANVNLSAQRERFNNQIAQGVGDMGYLNRNIDKRLQPDLLVEHTTTIINARLDYFPATSTDTQTVLNNSQLAYISRYALGRDYHKTIRQKLQKLARKIETEVSGFSYRVFSDSAPVLELTLAEKSGLGWRGKNNCIIHRDHGSWFFLGEIFTNLDLPICDIPVANHCGNCTACLTSCPTDAFVDAYRLNPTRCISYLTIEHHGAIPIELRAKMGNRIYGCDDCQLVCPWTRFKKDSTLDDFKPRNGLDNVSLLNLWQLDEKQFLHKFEGSAIRRIGFEKFQRNLAVAIGNSSDPSFIPVLQATKAYSKMTQEHIDWAKKALS